MIVLIIVLYCNVFCCVLCFVVLCVLLCLLFPRRAKGPGRELLKRPPSLSVCLSVCLSVTFSFRTVTRKCIAVFSRNFAGMCTMSWGCAV